MTGMKKWGLSPFFRSLLINPGRRGNIFEKEIGNTARQRELGCWIGRRQGLRQQVSQCAVALGNEPEVFTWRGGPESPELIEGANAFV